MARYHRNIGIPASALAQLPKGRVLPEYTAHARSEAANDKRGAVTLPRVLDLGAARLIEVTTDDRGNVLKALYRQPHDDRHDLVFSYAPQGRKVLTVWLNDCDDAHHTLNRAAYAAA